MGRDATLSFYGKYSIVGMILLRCLLTRGLRCPQPKKSKRQEQAESETQARLPLGLELADGDLLIMGGGCRQTHKHELPRTAKLSSKRISATFRSFK